MQTVQLFVLWQINISNWERSSLFWEKIHFSKLFFSYFFSKLILFFCFRSQLWQNTCGEQHRYLECVCVCVCVWVCVCLRKREREEGEGVTHCLGYWRCSQWIQNKTKLPKIHIRNLKKLFENTVMNQCPAQKFSLKPLFLLKVDTREVTQFTQFCGTLNK